MGEEKRHQMMQNLFGDQSEEEEEIDSEHESNPQPNYASVVISIPIRSNASTCTLACCTLLLLGSVCVCMFSSPQDLKRACWLMSSFFLLVFASLRWWIGAWSC